MNYRTERWPVVTLSLIGINTVLWLASLFTPTSFDEGNWYSNMSLTPAESIWYTYITSMFVHYGFMHIFGNMIFLFLFGCCVEDLIGRWRFLALYLLGGLAADFTEIAVTQDHFASSIPSCGASGAISTCMGMYLMLRPEADIEFKYFWIFFGRFGAGEFEVPAWMAIGFWFLTGFLYMLWDLYHPSRFGGVAYGAHIGGFLAGLAFMGLARFLPKKADPEADSGQILSPDEIQAAVPAHPGQHDFDLPSIYLASNGRQTGPFKLAEVQAKLAQNELPPGTLYWSEGMAKWEDVTDLAEHPASPGESAAS